MPVAWFTPRPISRSRFGAGREVPGGFARARHPRKISASKPNDCDMALDQDRERDPGGRDRVPNEQAAFN